AGLGRRMSSLTGGAPKEMLPLAGRPIIHHVVQEAIDAGIVEICIVIHKSKEEIRRYFESDNREAGEAERPAETLQSRCIVFILGSCVLGLGQRWLLRGSFAIAIVAIAIALGVQVRINGRSCWRTRVEPCLPGWDKAPPDRAPD